MPLELVRDVQRSDVEQLREPARTGTFDALGHRFAVACDDPEVVALLERAYAPLAVEATPAGWYEITRRGDRCDLTWNDRVVVHADRISAALDGLHGDVSRRAIAAADEDLVLHAGCVALDDEAIVVSGAPAGDRSTLVAALVEQGCEYLTDEVVPVELVRGHVRPFPRPLGLADHSTDLQPEVTVLRTPPERTRERIVMFPCPSATRKRAPLRVATVVFPERDASGVTLLERVRDGDAIVRLAEHAFNFPSHERIAIDTLTSVMRGAEAFVLLGDDPRAAASVIVEACRARRTS
jgi:hypothetical protein